VTEEVLRGEVEEGGFLEHAEVHGKLYGTSLKAIEAVSLSGRVPILDVDVQGVRRIKERLQMVVEGEKTLPPFHFLFVAPPSIDILKQRLKKRGTESDEQMTIRLGNAPEEIEYGTAEGNFDGVS